MGFSLFLVFVAVPLLELALLIKLGQWIGLWPTILTILLTAAIGIAIMQQQGFAAFQRAAQSMAKGEPPVEPVVDGFMLMIAGGLLVAPGLITDAAGLMLLIPPVRKGIARWGLQRLMAAGTIHTSTWRGEQRDGPDPRPNADTRRSQAAEPGPVIDGEFERLEEKTQEPSSDAGKRLKPRANGDARDP